MKRRRPHRITVETYTMFEASSNVHAFFGDQRTANEERVCARNEQPNVRFAARERNFLWKCVVCHFIFCRFVLLVARASTFIECNGKYDRIEPKVDGRTQMFESALLLPPTKIKRTRRQEQRRRNMKSVAQEIIDEFPVRWAHRRLTKQRKTP